MIPLIPKPGAGKTYDDPLFGYTVWQVSAADPADGEAAVIKPMYSTVPAWNCGRGEQSYLLLWNRKLGHVLYKGEPPYSYIGELETHYPTDIEQVLWDPVDPYVVWYPSSYQAKPRFIRQDIRGTQPWAVWKDFSIGHPYLPSGKWDHLLSLGSDPQWMGRGQKGMIGLRCGETILIYSIYENSVYYDQKISAMYKNSLTSSASEEFLQLDRWIYSSPGLQYRLSLGMSNPYEHACPGTGADGADLWNTVDFSHPNFKGALVSYNMSTGAPKVIIGPATAWGFPPSGTHISSIGPADLAAVGMIGQHNGFTPLDNVIALANTRTGKVDRLCHARTFAGTTSEGRWGYWGETHVSIHPDGNRIAFGSDWMNGPTVDTFIVDAR